MNIIEQKKIIPEISESSGIIRTLASPPLALASFPRLPRCWCNCEQQKPRRMVGEAQGRPSNFGNFTLGFLAGKPWFWTHRYIFNCFVVYQYYILYIIYYILNIIYYILYIIYYMIYHISYIIYYILYYILYIIYCILYIIYYILYIILYYIL